jgi:DNA topoisomerase-1|tara:strand:+ start:71 stop:325 length:255 start_codon:yes stop_codon:yes gene_type:complete
MLNWIKGMFGWSVIDEVEERPVTEVKAKAPAKAPAKAKAKAPAKAKAKAKAPAKTGGKKKGELSMTPTAIKQREARAKAKAVTQ